MGLLDFISNWFNRRWVNNDYVPRFFWGVERDIRVMKDVIAGYKALGRSDVMQNEEFVLLAEKYRRNYCPSIRYDEFSFDNQVKYVYLRTEIDEILKKAIEMPKKGAGMK